MKEFKEWSKACGEVFVYLAIVVIICIAAVWVLLPLIAEASINAGINIGEKL